MHEQGFWSHFDFATFLVLCTFITGVIWAGDVWVLAPRRKLRSAALVKPAGSLEQEKAKTGWEKFVELARSFFPVFLAVLVLRSFIVEPFKIPTGSMIPTLLIGDFILVNKASYGVRLPISNTKIISVGEPERGQVVVFRYPRNPQLNYIKRMIGLPGDTIEYKDKLLYVNGKEMLLDSSLTAADELMPQGNIHIYSEDLDGVKHTIQHMDSRPGRYYKEVVPNGHYFVMGDNRDDSADSREWGFVPEANLVGRAILIWFNLNFDAPWGEKLKWRRMGGDIQ